VRSWAEGLLGAGRYAGHYDILGAFRAGESAAQTGHTIDCPMRYASLSWYTSRKRRFRCCTLTGPTSRRSPTEPLHRAHRLYSRKIRNNFPGPHHQVTRGSGQGYERCEINYETLYMSTTSVSVLPRALNNATDIRLIMRSKAPGQKLAFHPCMVSHVASPIDPPVVKTSGWKVARVSPWGGSRATLS